MAEWLKKIIVLSLLLWGSGMAAWGQQVSGVDSAPIVNASSISADDTTVFGNERGMVQKMMKKNKDYWYRAMLRGRLDMKDEDVNYPKFVKFCVDTYNWADRVFNSYDSAYVVGTGKRWKLFFKNDNWLDSYAMNLQQGGAPVRMLSDPCCNIGGYIAYMAVSLGYMFDVGYIFFGQPVTHSKWDFNFTCALLSANLYYNKNTGGTNLNRLGDYNDGRWFKYEFPGLRLESYGIDVYYFFNNKRYSHGAAYSFSKIQKRSAGSLIAGLTVSSQDVGIDFSGLSDDMKAYLPEPDKQDYRFRYYDYCLVAGYGYNWVISKHWLFNISALPSFGFKHCLDSSVEGNTDLFSLNIKGMFALVYSHRDLFVGLHGKMDGHWYASRQYNFFNAIENLSLTAGVRF